MAATVDRGAGLTFVTIRRIHLAVDELCILPSRDWLWHAPNRRSTTLGLYIVAADVIRSPGHSTHGGLGR
jgi:hypothetical protein